MNKKVFVSKFAFATYVAVAILVATAFGFQEEACGVVKMFGFTPEICVVE